MLASIATVEVTINTETYFKPQFIINSEASNWDQIVAEYTDAGEYVYVHDAVGKYSEANSYNNFVIQSGWKNEGAVTILSVLFKDASGNIVYGFGDFDADVVTVADDTEEATDEAVEETKTETKTEAKKTTNLPKTGVVGLGLVYGLGALATGAILLKKRNK